MGENWWQASDGKWYPPDSHPTNRPTDAASTQSFAAPTPTPAMVTQSDGAKNAPRNQTWLLIGLGALIVVLVAALIVVIVGGSDDEQSNDAVVSNTAEPDDDRDEQLPPPSTDEASDPAEDPTEASGASADVNGCEVVDIETVRLDVTNSSSEQASYTIDVAFIDGDGVRLGDEPFFISYLRPGERTIEDGYAFNGDGAVSCEVIDVDRFPDDTEIELDAATCEIGGEDFAGDVEVSFVVENTSSELSDFDVVAALVRDGVRAGTSGVLIENVRPGETAPADGYSYVEGPASDVTCEIVYVNRYGPD
jgi:hypothetical protein